MIFAAAFVTTSVAAGAPAASEAAPDVPPVTVAAEVRIDEAEFLRPLAADPRVVALTDAQRRAAEAGLDGARALPDPEIGVERESLGRGEAETTLAVGWRPPVPRVRALRLDLAAADVEVARARSAATRTRLLLEWRRAFAGWAAAQARIEELERHRGDLQALVERTEARAEAGEVAGLDARRLALAVSTLSATLAARRADLGAARAAALAWRPDLPPTARPLLPDWPDPPSGEGDAAAGQRDLADPRLAAAEAEARSAALRRALAGRMEAPRLVAGWKRVEPGGEGASDDGPVLGLSWDLPLPRARRAARAAADAASGAAEARADLLRQRLDAELEAAEAALHDLILAAEPMRRAAASTAPAEAAARAAFAAGELDVTGLLDVLGSAHRIRLDTVDLLERTLAAERRLARLRGPGLDPFSEDSIPPSPPTGDSP